MDVKMKIRVLGYFIDYRRRTAALQMLSAQDRACALQEFLDGPMPCRNGCRAGAPTPADKTWENGITLDGMQESRVLSAKRGIQHVYPSDCIAALAQLNEIYQI